MLVYFDPVLIELAPELKGTCRGVLRRSALLGMAREVSGIESSPRDYRKTPNPIKIKKIITYSINNLPKIQLNY